jgi:CRP/FNR family cyclic AMP-dependent transcriptional regulator
MLTIVEKVICLQNVDVFSELPTEQLSYLAAIAEEVSFSEGDEVYRRDEASDALYVVLRGRVRIHRDDEELAIEEPDDAFGTWALFEETPRVATATAIEDTLLLRIDREDFLDILTDHVQITENVMKTLVGRLRGLLERVGTEIGPRPSS